MTTASTADQTPHNHPPRCCCPLLHGTEDEYRICPACTMHADLAQGVDCPQCHQPAGRPHTEYCTLAPERVWSGLGNGIDADVYPVACAYPSSNHGDGRGCDHDDCPKHGDPER